VKFINEWKTFLKEEDFLKGYPVEFDKDRNVVLYHISSTQDIEEFDPDIAAASAQNYTTRDYVTWNRPRVFFFTKKGQEDTGLGRIPGETYYQIKVPISKLYPVMEDPANLSSKIETQRYMVDNIPGFKERYEKAEKCDPNKEYNQWHICSKVEDSNGLAWFEKRFAGKKFLIDDPKFHSDKPNVYELVATLAEERYGTIGFIYPQESGDKNTLIAAVWRPVKASKLKSFY
tara:strand:- start:480 stop:1172 length:693 start_codon:yes stop_codon:yes gene_type:complete